MVGLAAGIFGLRYFRHGHRWYWLSGAAMLQVVVHGIAGLSYINAGFISIGLLVVGIAMNLLRSRSSSRGSEVQS